MSFAPQSAPPLPNKRDQLLEAAEELFSARGFANTRIAEIAAAAGTGISTFYRYFPTKDALLAARITERFAQLREELTQARETWRTALRPSKPRSRAAPLKSGSMRSYSGRGSRRCSSLPASGR
jgi:AcrR family transcriptional regulator